jgi:D-xylose transport system substrate-binding protein
MSHTGLRRRLAAGITVLAATSLAAGCATTTPNAAANGTSASVAATKNPTIAFLLPETSVSRWEVKDRPLFIDAAKRLCSACKVLTYNAGADVGAQLQQVDAALTAGANVLVITAVDGKSIDPAVVRAKAQGVPVIAYDRLIENTPVDGYIAFGPARVGELQGKALVAKLQAKGLTSGKIVALNGSPTDSNAPVYRDAAYEQIKAAGYTIAKAYDTPDWSPAKAQDEMDQAITTLGKDGFVGVLSGNDGMAGGAVKAMKARGINPPLPITGQDAELPAIQRILTGDQYMTVYTPLIKQAEGAVQMALAAARGLQPPAGLVNTTIENGQGKIPTAFLDAMAVTRDNLKTTIFADGFWKPAEICTGIFASACQQLSIQ